MIKWYFVIMLARVAGANEEIYVNEELGTILISKGLLLADQRSAYISSFIRVPNPLADVNLCNLGCGQGSVTLDKYLMAAGCKVGAGKTGLDKVADTVIQGIEYEPREEGVSGGRALESWCLLECLRSNKCKAFGVKEGSLCWLRSRALTHYELKDQVGSAEVDLACVVKNNRTKVCEELLKEDSMNYLMTQDNERFVREHWESINQLIKNSEGTMRRKRSIIGTLAGASIGFLATGFSFFEMNKLGDHVDKLRAEYNDFRERQVKFDKDQIEFNKEVLKIYKGLERETQKEIRRLHCGVSSLGFHILNMRRLMEWKDFLYQLYKDVLGGAMVGSISTVIFTKENMRTVIKETELLKGTIYEENPTLAYRLGTMSIVEKSIREDRFVIHVVLKLPIIKREELKVVFEVQQTGVRHGEAGVRYNLPRNVYKNEGKFYVLESPMCSMISNIRLCTSSINSTFTEMPCISDKGSCVGTLEKCSTNIKQSMGGVLVRSQEPIRAAVLGDPNTFDPEQPRANSVTFFNYSRYGDVLVGKVKIRGIRSATLDKVVKLSNPTQWLEEIRNDTRKLTKQNITRLTKIIEDQSKELEKMNESTEQNRRWTWYIVPMVIIMGLMIIGYECVWKALPEGCRERVASCKKCKDSLERRPQYEEITSSRKRTRRNTDEDTKERLEIEDKGTALEDEVELLEGFNRYGEEVRGWLPSITSELERVMRIQEENRLRTEEGVRYRMKENQLRNTLSWRFDKTLESYPLAERNKTLYDRLAREIGDEIIKDEDQTREEAKSTEREETEFERMARQAKDGEYIRRMGLKRGEQLDMQLVRGIKQIVKNAKETSTESEMGKEGTKNSENEGQQVNKRRAIYTVKFPGAKPVRVEETGVDASRGKSLGDPE